MRTALRAQHHWRIPYHTTCGAAHGRQVMLRVTDQDASIQYYTECLGCTLIGLPINRQESGLTAGGR